MKRRVLALGLIAVFFPMAACGSSKSNSGAGGANSVTNGSATNYDQFATTYNCTYAYSPGRMFADGYFANPDPTLGKFRINVSFEDQTGHQIGESWGSEVLAPANQSVKWSVLSTQTEQGLAHCAVTVQKLG